ncbi:Hint domain-containing protein [Algicola sagamiensis]|uniref:Hint domain-containing protein n=1 Tax=Algicola sagamiensis TaxID=163869 RepID=UPI00037A7F2A|nr:Hint domain-containing protein [Algicola sagamiensis]
MKNILFLSSVCAALLAATAPAEAGGARLLKRCEEDSLSNAQGHQRNDWAYKCKHYSKRTWEYNRLDDNDNVRTRPYYPTYVNPKNFDDWWRAPKDKNAACSYGPGNKYTEFNFCLASCYTPDQKILFADGEMAIFDAVTKRVSKIVTLDDQSTLHSLGYQVRDVDAYSESIRDVLHTILVLKTQSGGELKVTENHPLLVSTGHMRNAEDIHVGDKLIAENGSFDTIVSIEPIKYYGKVYNVKPNSNNENGVTSLNGQIVIAQGYLSGSFYYQNTGAHHVNRLVLRDRIPDNLI